MAQDIAASSLFLKYAGPLQTLFESYCAYGEPLNPHTLKSSKFIKMMRDAKLVKPMSEGSVIELDRARSYQESPKLVRAVSPLLKHYSTGFGSPRK